MSLVRPDELRRYEEDLRQRRLVLEMYLALRPYSATTSLLCSQICTLTSVLPRWDGQLGNTSFRTLFEMEEQDLFKVLLPCSMSSMLLLSRTSARCPARRRSGNLTI